MQMACMCMHAVHANGGACTDTSGGARVGTVAGKQGFWLATRVEQTRPAGFTRQQRRRAARAVLQERPHRAVLARTPGPGGGAPMPAGVVTQRAPQRHPGRERQITGQQRRCNVADARRRTAGTTGGALAGLVR